MEAQGQTRTPAQKRLSCDRCHARKLRCLRGNSMSKCSRCIQDGCVCTYSPPLKSGRPRKIRSPPAGIVVNSFSNDQPVGLESVNGELESLLNSNESSHSLPGGPSQSRQNSIINSNLGGMTPPSSYLSHLEPSLEAENANTGMDISPDISSWFDTGSTQTNLASTRTPSISSATPLSFVWSDLLPIDEDQACSPADHHLQHSNLQNSSHHYNNDKAHEPGGLVSLPADENSRRDARGSLGLKDAGPSNPHESNMLSQLASGDWSTIRKDNANAQTNSGGSCLSGTISKLSRLQQELVQFARPSSENSSDNGATSGNGQGKGRECGEKQGPRTNNPVNAILKPGQELLDIIRDLLSKCQENNEPAQPGPCFDQRMVLFVLTPLSLLLSTYSQLLREITIALHRCRPDYNPSTGGSAASRAGLSRPFSEKMFPPSTQPSVHFQSQQQQQRQPDDGFSDGTQTLVPESIDLTLGELDLDRQMQLILIVTVINRHLIYLEHALQLYQSEYTHGSPSGCISERLFPTILSEMRASVKVLISEARDLL